MTDYGVTSERRTLQVNMLKEQVHTNELLETLLRVLAPGVPIPERPVHQAFDHVPEIQWKGKPPWWSRKKSQNRP